MAWLHPGLLAGLAVVAVPIILHLMMRSQPKKILFPALQLIQKRTRKNVRRLRLRHFWLLAARMLALALLVLAIARPTLPPGDYRFLSGDWLRLIGLAGGLAILYRWLSWQWAHRPGLQSFEHRHRQSVLNTAAIAVSVLMLLLVVGGPYARRVGLSISNPGQILGDDVPVHAVMLFDTSLSMQLQFESQTRLEAAQAIARDHLRKLPSGSRVAVADTAASSAMRFSNDLESAQTRIASLTTKAVSLSLSDRIEAALQLQIDDLGRKGLSSRGATSTPDAATTTAAPAETAAATAMPAFSTAADSATDGMLREIYIFSDLASSAWRGDNSARIRQLMATLPGVGIYFIDLSVESPVNVSITKVTLSEQILAAGNELQIRGVVEAVGPASEQTVMLSIENAAGQMVQQGRSVIKIDAASGQPVSFVVPGLTGPVHQGELRLQGSDQLAFDDVRSFTVEVRPAPEVLLVEDVAGEARFIRAALAPPELAKAGKARYRCKVIKTPQFAAENLKPYVAVLLMNVRSLGAADWTRLLAFARDGGGVGVVMGDRVDLANYRSAEASVILPAELKGQIPLDPAANLDLEQLTHPMLQKMADWGRAEVTEAPFFRVWRVTPSADSSVVVTFNDPRKLPAVVEAVLGKGRVMLVTSPFSRGWNELVTTRPFVQLADQMLRHLSQTRNLELTLFAGSDFITPVNVDPPIRDYLLRQPDRRQIPGEIPEKANSLVIKQPDQLGNYRIIGRDNQSNFERGFSVNAPPEESRLKRLEPAELDETLGAGNYNVSRTVAELQRKVGSGRVGREAVPALLLLLVAIFMGEHLLANRFYESETPAEIAAGPTGGSGSAPNASASFAAGGASTSPSGTSPSPPASPS